MPIYEYKCQECGKVEEYIFSINERPQTIFCKKGEKKFLMFSVPNINYLSMGVDAIGCSTAGDKWARMHEKVKHE